MSPTWLVRVWTQRVGYLACAHDERIRSCGGLAAVADEGNVGDMNKIMKKARSVRELCVCIIFCLYHKEKKNKRIKKLEECCVVLCLRVSVIE